MKTKSILVVMAVFALTAISQATVVMDWVTVGDAGNVADGTGYGSVSNMYQIGKYEVTNSQYCEFLNAVAVTDTFGLYNTNMATGFDDCGGIIQTGEAGNYSYSVKSGRGNNPVNYVSWYDAIRFANWMHNSQGTSTTESGAYTITDWDGYDGTVSSRNTNAQVWLSTEDEWYKAAFYKGGGTNAGYWDYATQSDICPIQEGPPGGLNSANYWDEVAGYAVAGHHITDVGAYTTSKSFYGTFDQNGNMHEWNDAAVPLRVCLRGGGWSLAAEAMPAFENSYNVPTYEHPSIGFRVASVPEPATLLLLGLGAMILRRKR